jgi:hypothetical protein
LPGLLRSLPQMRYLLLSLCLILTFGCNREPPRQLRVHGKILVNGQPLAGGSVVFIPDEKRGTRGPIAFAVVDTDGGFDLATESGPGAVVGWHVITVAPSPHSMNMIDGLERYRHPDLSGLDYEVREGVENNMVLKLEFNQ